MNVLGYATGSSTATEATGLGNGFDGDQITLSVYYPDILPADLLLNGTATVVAGTTTFPSVVALNYAVSTLLKLIG